MGVVSGPGAFSTMEKRAAYFTAEEQQIILQKYEEYCSIIQARSNTVKNMALHFPETQIAENVIKNSSTLNQNYVIK